MCIRDRFTTNDSAYQTAIDWHRAGRAVVAVVDSRCAPSGEIVAAAKEMGIRVIAGSGVIEAQGGKRVRRALVAPLNTCLLYTSDAADE